jgi:hypothetical protein
MPGFGGWKARFEARTLHPGLALRPAFWGPATQGVAVEGFPGGAEREGHARWGQRLCATTLLPPSARKGIPFTGFWRARWRVDGGLLLAGVFAVEVVH